jgi:hypothetical protein
VNEKDFNFDQQMIEQLGEIIPPEDEIQGINPWSKPIGFITWGLILTTVHLNFLYLQYFLPTIGVILMFLGFRSLRNENKYFKVLWILSIIKLLFQPVNIIEITTPLNMVVFPVIIIGIVILPFRVAMFLIFHIAIKNVYKKADRCLEKFPLLWAALWAVVSFLIAISPLSESWLVFIPMIICHILIVRSLFSIGEQLDNIGYVLINAPVRINNRTFGWAYFLLTLAVMISCSIFYNHLQLEPQEYQPPANTSLRQHLFDMDFPVKALQYLDDQDVAMLSNAVNIEVFNKLLMYDPKKVEHRSGTEGNMYITHTYEPGEKNMESTTIYIEMPENIIYVMQYFNWVDGNPIWQDGIVIYGESREDATDDKEIISSSLFYSKKGIEYTADFPRLACEQVAISSMFGTYYTVPVTAAFSYPFGAQNQGGYILYSYTVKAEIDNYITHSTLNYIHRLSPLGIPYTRTEEQILNGSYMFIDELNQHYTTYESLSYKGK